MKYVSIDIETLGLDPKEHDIIEFAAVMDDFNNPLPLEELPVFHTYFRKPLFKGDPVAISMHSEIFKKICDPENNPVMHISNLMWPFVNWLSKHRYPFNEKRKLYQVNVAGKNAASFDIPFIKEHVPGPRWPDKDNYEGVSFKHRVLDPSILYFDPKIDQELPDMKKCMERAGITGEVAHTAVADAMVVIQLLRKKLGATGK